MTITVMELENTARITAVDALVTEAAVEEKPVAKVRKTKKVKEVKKRKTTIAAASKKKKKKTVSSHPTYEEMIKDAIVTLNKRTGSSLYAIQKFIEEKRKELPPTFRKLLLHNLKRLVASGKLVKVKASFKLPSASAKSSSPKAAAATSVPTKRKKSILDKVVAMVLKTRSREEQIQLDSLIFCSMDPEDPVLGPYLSRKDPPEDADDWLVDRICGQDITEHMRYGMTGYPSGDGAVEIRR